MSVQKINDSVYFNQNAPKAQQKAVNGAASAVRYNAAENQDSVSFKGKGSDLGKRGWLVLRKLSNYMKEPSEMTNAAIAAIGTGFIAPFAIMCSPGKKADNPADRKAAREKKKFQALRQPVSAALAFGFQVPTTIGIALGLNKLAYEKQLKLFDDEIMGTLIPDKKYLTKQARRIIDGKADILTNNEWAKELELTRNAETIKKEIIEQIKRDYEEVGISISNEELEKMAGNKKKIKAFLSEKMAEAKQNSLFNAKVKELKGKDIKITDLDLVTENYQDLAKLRYKEEFSALKNNARLNWRDKFLKAIGFSNKKLNELEKAEKALAQEKGLSIMKEEMPEMFKNKTERLRKFLENRNKEAQILYGNKIFWLTLATNLFMVAISCVALNWLHPKFAAMVEKHQERKEARRAQKNNGIEVSA